jgi:hypothetical protein
MPLGGRPGAFAARYAGEQASYEDNWRKLLQELRGIPSGAIEVPAFVTVAAIAFPAGKTFSTKGVLEGVIAEEATGSRGFGYDPVFFLPEYRSDSGPAVAGCEKSNQPSGPCLYPGQDSARADDGGTELSRGVAQLGSAPGLGPGCRRFKSSRPDQTKLARPRISNVRGDIQHLQ